MTTKEAIAILERLQEPEAWEPQISEDAYTALQMAIDALATDNNVPDRNVGDMISRQMAIDATWEEPSYTDPLNVLTEVRDRIKALPSAQPEPCEDAISREAAIGEIRECFSMGGCHADQYSIVGHINSLPPVTPKSRTGKWIRGVSHGLGVFNWTCDQCGHAVTATTPDRFCGVCGSDNGGEQDG